MRVLHAIHDFLPRHRAGSELYALELARALGQRGHDPHVLCAEYDPARPHGALAWREVEGIPVTEVVNNWAYSTFEETWSSPAFSSRLDDVLAAIEPEVLHLHSLLNLSFDLPLLARRRGIATVATLHDYTLVCPSGGQRVHLAEQHVCHQIDSARCARCFEQSPWRAQMAWSAVTPAASSRLTRAARGLLRQVPALLPLARGAARAMPLAPTRREDIEQRLAAARALFHQVDRWVSPSRALGDEMVRLGLPPSRLEIADYGFPPLAMVPREPRTGPLRIGFLGTLVWHKGVHVLIEALRELPAGRARLEVHGDLTTFPDYTADLRQRARDLDVRFAGAFTRGGLATILAGLDVVVVPSLWPENSPLVIHEAFQAGLPVVGSAMGGIPELVDHERAGLIYPATSAEALAHALRRLLDEPGLLERLAACGPAVRSLARDAERWEQIYLEVTS